MTPQQAAIAEKIPVLIKVDFLLVILFKIFKFERCIYSLNTPSEKIVKS